MLLTLTSTTAPATDLGYLLHKSPFRAHAFDLTFGKAHVFYPEAEADRCTAALRERPRAEPAADPDPGANVAHPILIDSRLLLLTRGRSRYPGRLVQRRRQESRMTEPWISVEDVATHLGVVKDSVYRRIDGRGLPAHARRALTSRRTSRRRVRRQCGVSWC